MNQNHRLLLKDSTLKTPLGRALNSKLQEKELSRMKKIADLFRHIHLKNTMTSEVDGREIIVNGKSLINYGSANYLGLDQHPEVIKAAQDGSEQYGTHSGCSRIFSQHHNILEFEDELADLVGAEAVLVYANVSQTHQGVIPTFFGNRQSTLFLDRFAHTSMKSAGMIAKGAGANLHGFNSTKLDVLERKLKACDREKKLVMIDGVYSMQGNTPELKKIQEICIRNNAILYIDDAHGLGVYGERGGGVMEDLGISFDNTILVSSLQKGISNFGGFVAGTKNMIDILKVSSNSYIFSGAIQPSAVEGGLAAVKICKSEEGKALRARMREKSVYIREKLTDLGYEVEPGDSPIIPVKIGKDMPTLLAGRLMFNWGIFLNSVVYPAVPKNEGNLRISLSATHSDKQIEALVSAFFKLKDQQSSWGEGVAKKMIFAKDFIKEAMFMGEKRA